jgi:hypothetical protein
MSCIFRNQTIQWRLCYYQHPIRFLQVTIRQLSSLNARKTISDNSTQDQRAKWYKNGLNRPLLSNTNFFEKRNLFLM